MTPHRGGCPPAAQQGFTLLEILVALAVLGFLMVGLSQGVRFGLRAWDSEDRMVATMTDLDGLERTLRTVIEQADPGDFNEPPNFKADAHRLTMNARMPADIPGLPVRDAEVVLGVNEKHNLVLRWVARPHAERLTERAVAHEAVLTEGVDHVDFSYRRWPQQGGGWVAVWELPTLPLQVSVKIVFRDTAKRHIPTIVVAPRRARYEG